MNYKWYLSGIPLTSLFYESALHLEADSYVLFSGREEFIAQPHNSSLRSQYLTQGHPHFHGCADLLRAAMRKACASAEA
jgi:hypothetical protein